MPNAPGSPPKYVKNPDYKDEGPASHLSYAKDDDTVVMLDSLLNFLTGKISSADLDAVKNIVAPEDGEMKVPAELATDSKVMARIHRAIVQGKRDIRNPPQSAADIARRKEMFGDWDRLG